MLKIILLARKKIMETINRNQNKIKVGLFGIGLDTYWPQFEGLYDRLNGYQQTIANKLNISRTKVSRYLTRAKKEKIVEKFNKTNISVEHSKTKIIILRWLNSGNSIITSCNPAN